MFRSVLIKLLILVFFIIAIIGVDFYIKVPPVPLNHNKSGPVLVDEAIEKKNSKRKLEGKVNINTATTDELALLPGIGEKIAEEIITFRKENGLFRDIEELIEVKGIGEKRLEEVKNFIVLDGETTLHYEFE